MYDYTSSWALRSTITPPSETAANGNVGYRNLGKSVSVSSDGTKIAYLGDQGTYAESGGTWTKVGQDIDGEALYDQSGWSVSMSSDGTRVAIGAPYNDANGTSSGHVRVYAESGGTWTKVGQDIDGEASGDNSG